MLSEPASADSPIDPEIGSDAAAPADTTGPSDMADAAEHDLGIDLEPSSDGVTDTSGAAGTLNSPVAEQVYQLLAPVVATAGVELLDVEWTGGTLRVVLDHEDGVTTDSLTTVNRLISPILDQHDPVPGRYTLEVSSPGVERPLRRPEHFRRAVGETIIIKSLPGVEPRRLKGLLASIAEQNLTVEVAEVDGVDLAEVDTRQVELADIASAKTFFDWGPGPKPSAGKGKPHNKNQKQSQRKAKKAAGGAKASAGSKSANKKKKGSGSSKSGQPQPNTAEQERGRP